MKVLIADDHRLIIEGVKIKLAELDPDVEAVVAMNIEELDRAVAEHADQLDLALVDIAMPGTQGHQHIAKLRAQAPSLPVIVLSGSEDPELMRSLLDLGVLGFIPKAYSPDIMLSAIRLVLAGGVYIPPLAIGQCTGAWLATRRRGVRAAGVRFRPLAGCPAHPADRTPDRRDAAAVAGQAEQADRT